MQLHNNKSCRGAALLSIPHIFFSQSIIDRFYCIIYQAVSLFNPLLFYRIEAPASSDTFRRIIINNKAWLPNIRARTPNPAG